jgi:hypothetical protein
MRQFGSVVEMFRGGPGAQQVVPPVGSATSHPLAPKYCSTQQVSFAKQFAWPVDTLVGGHGFRGISARVSAADSAKRGAEMARILLFYAYQWSNGRYHISIFQ